MRVLLIDDHALFRVGLQGLLERRGIEVAMATGDEREGLRLVHELELDVILLDQRMPRISGIDVLKRMRDAGVSVPIVMLTTSSEDRDLLASLRHGARGYLLKEMEPDDLVVALRDVVNGKTVVAPGLAGVLAQLLQQGDKPAAMEEDSPFAELTPREREILCHLSEGQSNKVIARHLGISDGTVKLHVKAILRKLSVHSRVEAAVMAVERGFCDRSSGSTD